MKLYVASKFENYKKVINFEKFAMASGHEITYSWASDTAKPVLEEGLVPDKQQCAVQDMEGVKKAHLLVLLLTPVALQGALVEFGMALAQGKEVWLVGDYDYDVIFFHLPFSIKRMRLAEAYRELRHRLPSVA